VRECYQGTICSSVLDLSVGEFPLCVCVRVKMCTSERSHSVWQVEVLSWLISSTAVISTHWPSELSDIQSTHSCEYIVSGCFSNLHHTNTDMFFNTVCGSSLSFFAS